MYLERGLERRLERSLAAMPLVILEGARATGKTELVRRAIDRGWLSGIRSFLDPIDLQAATAAPRDYIFGLPHGTAIDEAQLCEKILLPVKERIESAEPGSLLLTGSTRLRRDELGGSDPLAGRVGRALHLGPLAIGERAGKPKQLVEQLFQDDPISIDVDRSVSRSQLIDLVQQPGLPGVFTSDQSAQAELARAYVAQATTQSSFESVDVQRVNQLARYLAGRTSTLVNVSEFGTALELNRSSVDKYLAHLEEALLIVRLPGWRRSKDKSETDRAKLHFFDAGIAAATARMMPASQDDDLGRLTETLLVTDLARQAQWLSEPPSCYHWRRSNRDEVDLVLEASDGRAVCVEVKVAENVNVSDFRGIDAFRKYHPNAFQRGFVFYTGKNVQSFGEDRWAIPFGALGSVGAEQSADPMESVIAAVGSRRRQLSARTLQRAGSRHLVAAQGQLEVLGSALDGFDADVRVVDGSAVLLVRPDRVPSIGFNGEVSGVLPDAIRLVEISVDESTKEITGVVETRPGTWARTPIRKPMDERDPESVIAAVLVELVDDLAFELTRIEQELG